MYSLHVLAVYYEFIVLTNIIAYLSLKVKPASKELIG